MIFDIFSFYNEIKLLKVRLHELYDVVDYFVLVEADTTHSGEPKPYYYHENKYLFRDFKSKICNLAIRLPTEKDKLESSLEEWGDLSWIESDWQFEPNWIRERHQRNATMWGLQNANPDDIVIIEDADEIVRADVITELGEIDNNVIAVEQSLHTYYLNWKCNNMPWAGSKIIKKKNITTASEIRCHRPPTRTIKNGGWHFGFLGGAEKVKDKIQAYAHQEFNNALTLEQIQEKLDAGKDGIGRLYQYDIVPIDETYPKYIRDNLYLFDDWVYKGE